MWRALPVVSRGAITATKPAVIATAAILRAPIPALPSPADCRQIGIISAGRSMASKAAASRWAQPDQTANAPGMSLREVQRVLDEIAPPSLAESWDNVGLLLGTPSQRVTRALVTIDLTAAVLEEAAEFDADLIVAYHPPIFSALKRLTKTPLIQRAAAAGCAIYSPHTALDAAPGGTNDFLAQQLGLSQVVPLKPSQQPSEHKLVVFVPRENAEAVLAAMHGAGAGVIGEYDFCSFQHPGTGTFRGSDKSNPHIGTAGQLEHAEELRVEVVVPPRKLDAVIAALRSAHPYEEPAFDVYERVSVPISKHGGGRIGTLPSPMSADQLAAHVKKSLGLTNIMIATPTVGPSKQLRKVGLCAGAGSDFVDTALAAGADAFVTGEMRHHDALRAAALGITTVTTLHSDSERGALGPYADTIRKRAPEIEVRVSSADRDPFVFA